MSDLTLLGNTTKGNPQDKKQGPPNTYDKFIEQFKKQWLWFNFITTFCSIGIAVGTFLIAYNAEYNCGGIVTTLWLVFVLNIVNMFATIVNMSGFEKRLCTGPLLFTFFIFEITILVYMQVIYFESMQADCIVQTPL